MALDAEYQTRLESLYAWRRDFHASNVGQSTAVPTDMDYADAITATFAETLGQIFDNTAARTEWSLALTAMIADLDWLEGITGSGLTTSQGGNVGNIWRNPSNLRYYKLTGVTADAVAVDGGPVLDSTPGAEIEPAVSSVWVSDLSSFTLTRTINAVVYVYTYKDEGLTNPATGANLPTTAQIDELVRKWTARMDYVLTLAGIVPKSNASSGAGACWRDYPEESHWWVDTEGYYLPAFTNQAYHSARRDSETGQPYSTKEFGFGLVVACPQLLREGDTLTIRIERVDANRPYQVGDEAVIQTVAAGPAFLTGGIDGTDELTWRVIGSTSGSLPDYVVPLDATIPNYTQAGLTVGIAPGGIPFELGDRFTMSVEAGRWRWRKDSGAWSAAADIPASGTTAVTDGLTAQFLPGAAPAFVADDAYSFRALQPYAPANLKTPLGDVWAWTGASANVVFDLGSIVPLSCIALARYDLPTGAAVTAELSADGITYAAPIPLNTSGRVSVQTITETTARYVRLSVTTATGGSIGYAFAGLPWTTNASATRCTRNRRLSVSRGSALNATGLYRGMGDGWSVEWENWLKDAEADELLDMARYLAERDEPLVFVPHYLHPEDSALVTLQADQIEIGDRFEYQPNDSDRRMLSASIELEPVLA